MLCSSGYLNSIHLYHFRPHSSPIWKCRIYFTYYSFLHPSRHMPSVYFFSRIIFQILVRDEFGTHLNMDVLPLRDTEYTLVILCFWHIFCFSLNDQLFFPTCFIFYMPNLSRFFKKSVPVLSFPHYFFFVTFPRSIHFLAPAWTVCYLGLIPAPCSNCWVSHFTPVWDPSLGSWSFVPWWHLCFCRAVLLWFW